MGLKEAHEQAISDPKERYAMGGLLIFMMENYFWNPLSEEARKAYRKEYERLEQEYGNMVMGGTHEQSKTLDI